MKYAFVIPDGFADYPIASIGAKTPIEVANTPFMDEIAKTGMQGLCPTTPPNKAPGSDVCTLSLLGYDSSDFNCGRAPLEAASLGIPVGPKDLVLRCNLIHVGEKEEFVDHCAGHISSEESHQLIQAIQEELGTEEIQFYPGVSYRHIVIWKNHETLRCTMTPPHDVPGKLIKNHLPEGVEAPTFLRWIEKSRKILKNHPVNLARQKMGKLTANSIWIWGGGHKPVLTSFQNKFGVKGGVISGVDLIRGIAKFLELEVISVPGITAYFDTDYAAKGRYAVDYLKNHDFVLVHVEATDEAGHVGNFKEKILSLERIDQHIVAPLYRFLKESGDFRFLIAPDHFTPSEMRIHVNDPVPFVLAGKGISPGNKTYSEKNAQESGFIFKKGYDLMPYFLKVKDS
jgi:2,3-bisphosphoglycerate-independent phosphoglycerate mutase